ncbi:BLUF domain-containing protein [Gymnodinialimonas hymeniacidonis]|uniref:BLUF domain-containing protein n=1 Tax=Gymnodinialimonas hymeniacidonis TaxID=3126508 RepID=UPI0034C5B3C1
MHRVIYRSRATRYFSAQGIEALSATCRRNNAGLELTGILVFHEGRFFQVLEGEDTALLSVMQAITKDARHTQLELLEHGPVERRAFQSWRMGYAMPEGLERPPLAAFSIRDLLSPDSQYRGRDASVRDHVRLFLSSLQKLPSRATG